MSLYVRCIDIFYGTMGMGPRNNLYRIGGDPDPINFV